MIINKLKWISIILCLIFSGYWSLLEFPLFLYSYKHINTNLIIYSDKEFPNNIEDLTDEILQRLKKSELYKPESVYRVHIPTESWRWKLITMPIGYQNIGGFCIGFRRNVFMRPSDIAENKIISPGKKLADAKERDLVYFITHEVGHALMFDRVGVISNFTDLPVWLQEGYPDYIAKKTFDFESNLKQFKNNEKRLTKKSGLYVRYHLFISYLIDKKGYTIEYILNNIPQEKDIINILSAYTIEE